MASDFAENATCYDVARAYAEQIKGKTVLTTGVTPSSLGALFVEVIAAHSPKLLILAGRTRSKLEAQAARIGELHPGVATRLLPLDLASNAAVCEAAAQVNGWDDVPHIDVLVNSAGIMAVPYGKTVDGIEMTLAANHVGHFLFTNLIMAKILASPAPRVVSITSDGHRFSHMRWHDMGFHDGESYHKWLAYGQSKTANMLFARALARKLGGRGLQAFSVHPGSILGTGLATHLSLSDGPDNFVEELTKLDQWQGHSAGWTGIKLISAEEGAATHVFAAFANHLKEHNGEYLLKKRVGDPWKDEILPWATSDHEAERLWLVSEDLAGQKFEY